MSPETVCGRVEMTEHNFAEEHPLYIQAILNTLAPYNLDRIEDWMRLALLRVAMTNNEGNRPTPAYLDLLNLTDLDGLCEIYICMFCGDVTKACSSLVGVLTSLKAIKQ